MTQKKSRSRAVTDTKNASTKPATAPAEDEFYDDATSDFAKIEHLAPSTPPNYGAGRLVAIWALKNGERKNDEGKLYPWTETVTLVLDDGPDGDQASEMVGTAPVRLDGLQHSTTGLVARLSKRVEGVNAKGVKLKYRPMIGRVNTQASKKNKNVAAFSIAEPTDDDRKIVQQYKDLIISINQELEAKDAKSADENAFG
jgi:hypothetical protein